MCGSPPAARAGRAPGGTCRCRPRPRAAPPGPRPSLACSQRSSSSASSCSRPTSGVSPPPPCRASKRPSAALAERPAKARTGSAKPLSRSGRGRRARTGRPGAGACPRRSPPRPARPAPAAGRPGSGSRRRPPPRAPRPRRPGRRPRRGRSRSRPGPRAARRPAWRAGHGLDDGEPGRGRRARLVLVRPGPAEVGQHAVAHELGDVALEAGDLARDRVLVGARMTSRISSGSSRAESAVEPTRSTNITVSCRRSGWDAARGGAGRGIPRGSPGPREGRRRGRAAMASSSLRGGRSRRRRDLLEVVGGQLGQDLGVDVVVAERLLVLPQPSPRSQAPTSTPVPRSGVLAPGCSLSRTAVERAMERHERSAPSRRRSPASRCAPPSTAVA